MKKMWKKMISILLVVVMIGGVAPLGVLAEMDWLTVRASAETYSGSCGANGNNVTWSLDTETGLLTISGSGNMRNYSFSSNSYDPAPWSSYGYYIKTVVIVSGVTSIGDFAFNGCSQLSDVTIPDSVTSIGQQSFNSCTNLTMLTLPSGVKSIGYYPFSFCRNLTMISADENNLYFSSDEFGVLYNKSKTSLIQYPTGSTRTSFSIPSCVTNIGTGAFYSCEHISSVTIPSTVTSIGYYVFSCCTSLVRITVDADNRFFSCDEDGVLYNKSKTKLIQYPIGHRRTSFDVPLGVISIDGEAFGNCVNLVSISLPDSMTSIGYMAFYACSSLTSITIPNSVKSIGDYAFDGCGSLPSVMIPNSVTSIGNQAFSYCSSLTAFTVDTDNRFFSSDEYGVLYNKSKTTLIQYPIGNPRISFMIPDTVTSIGNYAFENCSSLVSVTILKGVKSIGDSAFYGCSKLSSIMIPNSVTRIGNYAFQYCSRLASVTIPKSVSRIGSGTFQGCYSLVSVTIPNSVRRIEDNAFLNCSRLTDVYYADSETQWKAITIGTGNEPLANAAIHYSAVAISTRDVTELWKPDVLFSRDSTVYDPELAYVAGWLCDQSEAETDGDNGKGEQKMRAAFDTLGFDENDTDLWYFGNSLLNKLCFGVASSEKDHLLVIVFRGSKEFGEFINDYTTGANSEMWGFHAYDYPYDFYHKVSAILENDYIEKHPWLKTDLQKVLITGHSLGGAGANLLAFDWIKHTTLKKYGTWYENSLSPENIYCYTFGALDSINDLYEDGSKVPTLPVKDGYENIHNIYNLYDTFGILGECRLDANYIGEIIKKIGQMHFFADDRKQDKKEWWSLGLLPIAGNTTNHDMPTYLDAVYNGIIDNDYFIINNVHYDKTEIESDLRKVIDLHRLLGVVKCPVDVEIYENGVLVGRTNKNVVDQTVTTIDLVVIDDVKYFLMENDREYRVIFRAFDEGEMSYTVYENGLTHPNDAAVFRDVALTEGKTMVSEIGKTVSIEDIRLYVTNEAGEKTAEILPDGSEREIVSLCVVAPETVTYKKPFTASAQIDSLPAGAHVEWTADIEKVQFTPTADGKSCTVKSASKGTIMLTATVYDTDGETLAKESASVTVKYAWWQWLIRIFLLGFIWY